MNYNNITHVLKTYIEIETPCLNGRYSICDKLLLSDSDKELLLYYILKSC